MIIFRLVAMLILTVLAIALIVFGIIAMIAPTPLGFVFVILGFVLLAIAAPDMMRALRKKSRWLDHRLDDLAKRSPAWIARRLKNSDPDDDDG